MCPFTRHAWMAGILAICSVAASAEIRVSAAEALQNAVVKPNPEFSSMARKLRVSGKVEVEAVVTVDGNVESAKALTGNPLLSNSAVDAVRRWKFKPFTSNGEPTRAIAVLSFTFKL